ncbi:amino acid adenylation domain-containing protein [Pleurocapsales cyanobacterium LEGE 06147]|nr:amino acid adenylation domain-containing protein [Pleurocapsales cyanobacterium LEGE 06147]
MQKSSIEGFRLSPQQKRLWQLQQAKNNQPYCAYCSILVEGKLNKKILESALKNIINRHEILRTNFLALQGMSIPLQVITENKPTISYYDWSEFVSEEKDPFFELLFDKGKQHSFDFENNSLVDIFLVLLAPNKYVLLICLPALCADRATLKNLVSEISHTYTAYLHNQEVSEEPLQYADLAEWQNELFEGEDGAIVREYWLKKKEVLALANWKLPNENQATVKPEFKPELLSLWLESDRVAKLEAIAHNQNTSLSILLLACWQILLWRLTGKSDITIGTYCDGRNYEELKSALGLLAKYLPVSCHLEVHFKFSEIFKQISESKDEAFKWQESFTWEQIAESKENTSGLSFFPVCFEFEEQPGKYSAADISFSIDRQYVCFDQFKLKLSCVYSNEALLAEFHYDSALFQVENIECLAGQFQTLLESIIDKPEAAISELEILSDRQRQQLLIGFNQTQTDYPQDKCIHQLFEEQVVNTPDNIALIFEDQQLTYAELNTKANQLAHHLKKLGVGPEVLVGLYLERRLELIVGLLAILKAGGAYLPLDPALPKESLTFRLQDAQVSVLLTQQQLLEMLPKQDIPVVCLDSQWQIIAQESKDNPYSEVKIEHLAYVLFTSGSTGQPKGVAVEHRQLLNYVKTITEKLDLSVCQTFATVSTFAADLGNTTIFPSLVSGGCLHVVSPERAANPEALADYFYHHPVDCLKIVPSHLVALLTSSHPEHILPRQQLILGGEACSWPLIEQIRNYAPKCLIFNHYGPTETTVGVLTYPINPETPHVGNTVPLGRPLANTQIYLLNSYLQPVPIGVPGELYIGGAGVTRGYLNRPELTAEKFITNPFVETGMSTFGQRLYKTGDLARYLPDGNIEFLGRIDQQVKIHGFRIELGEIEAVLRQHRAVRETVVIAREDQSGNKRLVAYVVPVKRSTLTTNELREFLQEKLPEYMVPSSFVQLEALPLTPNGKIDRQALPAQDLIGSKEEGTFVAPRTATEKVLAKIWAKILRLEQIGVHDNFFELGGDSILSMQIIARANQAGLKLTPKQLFEHQTIAELAAVAGINQSIQAEQGLVIGQVPLTPIQHWFFAQNLPEFHHWNQSILLEVRQPLDPVLLEQTVQKLLEHHDALRLRFVHQETGWQQFEINPDEVTPFTRLDLSKVAATEQEPTISTRAAELQTSLNLSSGPLMRVAYFDLGADQPGRLLLIIHHLAVDGVSWRILLEDIQTIYQQLSQGQAIQLPAKTTSFQHWAKRLTEYAQSQAVQKELDYWLNMSRQQAPHLPVEFSEGENTFATANTVSVTLSQEETQTLLQAIPAAYQTQINEVLLTALVQAVGQWTGTHSLLVDLEGHGREEIFDDVDLSRTVGWFTTIFPVLLDIGESASPGDALKAIKEQIRSIPNRGVGYGILRYLNGEKVTSWQHRPQAEIRFNYLGQIDQVFQESSLFVLAQESQGATRSLRGSRSYLLDINGIVVESQLRLDWIYSEAIHQRTTIKKLAESFGEALRSLLKLVPFYLSPIKLDQQTKTLSTTSRIVETLKAEAILDTSIHPEKSFEQITEPSQIFLTGATGFVGAFLLYELLQQTNADIYCLVRSPNIKSEKNRLKEHLQSYLIWQESFSNRIIPIVGDLSQPFFGVTEEQFQVLADTIDVIYHNGASINLVYPYSILKAANVLGTQEILRLASHLKVKPVHYISTLSVLSSKAHAEVKEMRELHSFNHQQVPSGGYAQTKWVAEKLVTIAHERGLPACIYRLGRVSGHSKTGVCNTNDRMYRMIKGFIQLKCAPDLDVIVDMTPVDYVSKAIVHISRQQQSFDKIFHLANPRSLHSSQLFKWMSEFGYPLEPISYEQLQVKLVSISELSPDNPLYPLIPFFAGMGTDHLSQKKSLEETSNLEAFNFHCQNTVNGLANTSIVCPPVGNELLSTYFSYLIQSGFLQAPQSH